MSENDHFQVGDVGKGAVIAIGRYAKSFVIYFQNNWFPVAVILGIISVLLAYLLIRANNTNVGPMSGEWNVAVAGFTPIGEETIGKDEANIIGYVFFNRVEAELSELGKYVDLTIEVRGPNDISEIKGEEPGQLALQAEKLATKINADIVIYGIVSKNGNALRLTPYFFIDVDNFYEAEEIVGQHSLGERITIVKGNDNLPSQIKLNRELSKRAQALALITRGLSMYSIHAYEDAIELFYEANSKDYWNYSSGREVVYQFIGNASAKVEDLASAETAYTEALKIEPEYGRSYAGLANVKYLQALQGVTPDDFFPDKILLDKAINLYWDALEAKIKPETADVPERVAFGLGQVYFVKWFLGEDTLTEAINNFTHVLNEFNNGENHRLQETAAEAYGRLGLIERQLGNIDKAIELFSNAIELSSDPSRRGLYWATLADMYNLEMESVKAEEASVNSINEYLVALSLTNNSQRQAKYWAAISNRYLLLGDNENALESIHISIELVDPTSQEYPRYKDMENNLLDK